MSAAESESRFLGCIWLGPGLGEPRLSEKGAVHLADAFPARGVTIAFESIDDLDAVIGELSAARFRVATEQLAAESARQDSTPKDSTLAMVERHHAHPELVNMGRPCDNECGGIAVSPAEGRCQDCVEYSETKRARR